ncbi:MFS transporter [Alisedimentitalea sp. MJ-SS2]|uniref:MFS transporter n=1 Tax=Aliisedimentitalea sp. MJ-SS2 TaxID=3049795 RepID=UPI00290F1D26|nr:MFS transporter [Alisedimentitalea sp. MJ-SS2]MDU8929410.1 MFS transporter [Alisedimentitalea sp. MJ-SS2]
MTGMKDRRHFLFLNIGHFLDHLFTLIFATVVALVLAREWGMEYARLIPYATPGLIAFGVFSLPAGWLADRWSREGMMAIFFIGIGLASVLTSAAQTPVQMALGLFVVGMFAAIYHPVGLAMIARGGDSMGMDIAVNGVWGNMGVGCAALLTGVLIDVAGWRAAFWVPGGFSVLVGVAYLFTFGDRIRMKNAASASLAPTVAGSAGSLSSAERHAMLIRVSAIIFFTTAVSSIIFQGTTFSLPKVFEERLQGIAGSATLVGWMAFMVFAVASMAQIVVGRQLDRHGPRSVFAVVATIQLVFFSLMPGLTDWAAVFVALAFMLGAFGQIPINDYMIGRMAKSELRAMIYGTRYIISFGVWATVVPLIAWVHHNWGFDVLFYILAWSAAAILLAVFLLPKRLPDTSAAPVYQGRVSF